MTRKDIELALYRNCNYCDDPCEPETSCIECLQTKLDEYEEKIRKEAIRNKMECMNMIEKEMTKESIENKFPQCKQIRYDLICRKLRESGHDLSKIKLVKQKEDLT